MFVYNRPQHALRTIEALKANDFAAESDLIIFSDGPKSEKDAPMVEEVRKLCSAVEGFKSVRVVEQACNLGLARSIISGVTEVVDNYGRIIVLEDDMVTSPYFLRYMNEALELYENEDRVISIHGYAYPVAHPLPETFFLRGADCWGWATWQRGWACFNSNGRFLLDELKCRKLIRAFDFNGSYPYSAMLEGQIYGKNDSWAIRWNASAFLAGKLTLYPGRSLVLNIGNDCSGTHCGKTASLDSELSATAIHLSNIVVEPSKTGNRAFEEFFRQSNSGLLRRVAHKSHAFLLASRR
jgi:hypothetical protein